MAGGYSSPRDDIALGAFHDSKQFVALRLGHIEFRHRVVEVLAEGVPLILGDLEVFMGFAHGTAGVVLGATCRPTDHLGDVVFEARRADAVMRSSTATFAFKTDGASELHALP